MPGSLKKVIVPLSETNIPRPDVSIEMRTMEVALPEETTTSPEQTRPVEASVVRKYLLSRGNSAIADKSFKTLMAICAASIFGIKLYIIYKVFRPYDSWLCTGQNIFSAGVELVFDVNVRSTNAGMNAGAIGIF